MSNLEDTSKRLEYLFQYNFESASDLAEKIKPITDELLVEIENLRYAKSELITLIPFQKRIFELESQLNLAINELAQIKRADLTEINKLGGTT